MHQVLLTLVFILFTITRVVGKAPDSLTLTHFNIKNGLPSNHVYYTCQDRNGYTWIFTDNGIVKYNGYSFKHFNTSTGLPSSDVWNCYQDSLGRMWLGTYAYEIGYIKNDVYTKINIDTKGGVVKIRNIFERNGLLYLVGSANKDVNEDLYIIDSLDNVKRITVNADLGQYLIGDSILLTAPPSTLFLKLTATGLKYVYKTKDLALITKTNTSCSQLIGYHKINFKTAGDTLQCLDLKIGELKTVSLHELGASDVEKVYVVYVLGDKFYVLTNRRCYILSKDFHLLYSKSYQELLPGPVQLTYYSNDKDKNEWYATSSTGCYMLYSNKNRFISKPVLNVCLANARKVGQFKDGTTWWFDEVDLQLMSINNSGEITFRKPIGERVSMVAEGRQGGVFVLFIDDIKIMNKKGALMPWINNNKPFYYIREEIVNDPKKGSVSFQKRTELTDIDKNESLKSMSSIHEYKPGKMYSIGFYGLRSLSSYTDSLVVKLMDPTKYVGMYYDRINNLYWCYNKARIAVLNPVNDEVKILNNEILKNLNLNAIDGITGDSFCNIYIQDAQRLVMYNTRSGIYKSININAYITDAKIAVHHNMLIVADAFGVAAALIYGPLKLSEFRFIPNIKLQYYNKLYDILLGPSGSAILHTDAGYWGLDIGILKKSFGFKTEIPENRLLVITPFAHTNVDDGDTVNIAPETDRISLDYINYLGKGNTVYNYRIENEEEWYETPSGEIFLASLKPGAYSKIYCRIGDDIWKSKLYRINVYKVPYWYQTSTWHTIFGVTGIILFIGIIFASVLVTRTIIANTNEKRRMQVELELRAVHAQINPHFIFNTLSSALYFINKKKIDEAYSHVSKFSKLLRSYIKASRSRYIVLAEELEILNNYVELQRIRFENKFDYVVQIDKRIPVDSIQIPSLLLQPLVENAINHGLFHRASGGLLILKFEQGVSSNELICYIDDNGIGREKAKEIKKESVAEYESYGNKLTAELIDLFRKYEKMDINVSYIDKQLPETGTIVKLTIRNMRYVA